VVKYLFHQVKGKRGQSRLFLANQTPLQVAIVHGTFSNRVTQEKYLGLAVREIQLAAHEDISIAAIRRGGETIAIDHETCFELGDEVLVVGRVSFLLENAPDFGEEISDKEGLDVVKCNAQVVVSKPGVIGIPVHEIRLQEHIGALVLGVTLDGIYLLAGGLRSNIDMLTIGNWRFTGNTFHLSIQQY
jgi:uncharacterized transporter YbjL